MNSPWSYNQSVRDPKYPTFNGMQVLLAPGALTAFMNYMNKQKLPFTYDAAVAFVEYVYNLLFSDFFEKNTNRKPLKLLDHVLYDNFFPPGISLPEKKGETRHYNSLKQ
jgi:hypothetical protein